MKNKRLVIIVLTTVILLLIPIIAMQFTEKVDWTMFGFIVGVALLLGTGVLFILALKRIKNIWYRIAICIALLVAFILIWAELAVGIFGTPFGGQ